MEFAFENTSSLRSTVFHAMFTSDMIEKSESKVNITDMEGSALKDMIMYMYSGKVDKLSEKAVGLLPASEKYDLQDLKVMCENSMCSILDSDNVLGRISVIKNFIFFI